MKINIPNNLSGVQLDAYKEIANKLFENPEVDTLFFSGSFYHGGSDINSDLDFIAITNPEFDYFQRIQGISLGVFYELFLYSEKQLKKSFDLMDYQDMHMIGYGFLVFSKSDNYQNIKDLAKVLFDNGPSKITDKQLEYEKYLLWDKYSDISDVIDKNPGLAKSLMNLLLWDSLRLLYIDKCIWFPKKKRLIESLTKIDVEICNLVNDFFNSSKDEKYSLELINKIVEHVISPKKLSDPFIWKSEKKLL